MPDVTTLVFAGGVWALLLVLAWAMCVAAGRADGQEDRSEQARTRAATVVADTGAIREDLRDYLRVLGAEQLTVTVMIDGRDAILARVPGVIEARVARGPHLTVPVRVGGRRVALLHADRPPGKQRFDAADMLVMQGLCDRVASAMQTAHPSARVPLDEPSAMA